MRNKKKSLIFLMFIALSTILLISLYSGISYASSSSLAAKKEEEHVLKKQINFELKKLNEIESKIHHIKAAQKAKIKNLIALYSSMSPRSAAAILPKINKGLAIYILSHMAPRTASAIVSRMPVKDAAFFTNSIAGK